MKKIILILVTLCITSGLFAEITVDTGLRTSMYWALDEDADYSYKFDDNGYSGFSINGAVDDHTTFHMNIIPDGFDAEGGTSTLSVGNISFTTELWKNVLGVDSALNDNLSVKLLGGIRSFSAPGSYGFVKYISYGNSGVDQASVGTESGLSLGTALNYKVEDLGSFTGTFGMLSDLGKDGFQQVMGGRDEDESIIGKQAPQTFASLGFDLLGKRGSYATDEFQFFTDISYASVGGSSITPSDFLTDTGSGSVRTGGHTVGGGARVSIPMPIVENDPYSRLTVGGSFSYFAGSTYDAEDLLMTDWDDETPYEAELNFDSYYTYGADLGWGMPFSENFAMDIGFGIRGRSAQTYDFEDTDTTLDNETLLQLEENMDIGGSIIFQYGGILDGVEFGIVGMLENLYNGQSLPNLEDDKMRGSQNLDPNLIVMFAGGVQNKIGKGMLTTQLQAGVFNALENDLYVSTSDDSDMDTMMPMGAVGASYAFDGVLIDLGYVYTPMGGMETSLLDIKTGRPDLQAGAKSGIYFTVSYNFK
ncbi:MAG: hypothetical protein OCD02_15350 [Spirochaetaceae bacterium]